jgi:RNA-directed DNA polymerase
MAEGTGEAQRAAMEGTESLAAKRGTESPAIGEQLMEEVCERENCKQALARVKANKGSAGVDGMTVHDLPDFLKQHWPAIREQLLSGTYKPQPDCTAPDYLDSFLNYCHAAGSRASKA